MLRVNSLSGFGRIIPAAGGGGDADVAAFISATGISDPTIEAALETLVTSLKADGIWTKCVAIYPFVGGDATKHSYNLKNTAAFQITWNGTVTHNANGIAGNGSTGYGDTGLDADTLTMNSTHLAVYSRSTGGNDNMYEMGAGPDAVNSILLGVRYFNFYAVSMYSMDTTPGNILVSSSNGQGFVVGSRRASNDLELYRNGSSLGSQAGAVAGSLPANQNIFVCARNGGGTAAAFSNRNLVFASIGAGLTDAEVTAYNSAMTTFQTALSRNV